MWSSWHAEEALAYSLRDIWFRRASSKYSDCLAAAYTQQLPLEI
jgi:hypothetical protein